MKNSESKQQEPNNANSPENKHNTGLKDQSVSRRARGWRMLGLFVNMMLAIASTLMLVLIMSILLFVYSQNSREWTIAQGLPAVLSLAGIQLDVRNLQSPALSDWRFDYLSVHINNDEIFELDQVDLQVNDWSLFRQGLDIKTLSLASIRIHLNKDSMAKASNPESETGFNIYEFLNHPLGLRIQTLDVKRIEVIGLAEELPALSIFGNAFLNIQSSLNVEAGHLLKTDLELKVLESIPSDIKLQATLSQDLSGKLNFSIDEAPGGWLTRLISFPDKQGIHGQLSIELQADDSHERVTWQMIALELPWYRHRIDLNGSGSWQFNNQKLQISHADLVIDQSPQRFSGWWQDQDFVLDLELNKLPLALAAPFQDLIKGGVVSGKLNASGSVSNPHVSTQLDLQTAFLQRSTSLQVEAEGDLKSLNIRQADLKIDKAKARVSGMVNIEQQTLDLKVHQLQGPVSIIDMFDAQLPEGLSIDLLQTEGTVTGDILAPRYTGKTKAQGIYKTQAFRLNGGFDGDIEKVKLISARLNAGETSLNTNGLIDWQAGKLDLAYIADKAPESLLTLAGVELPENLKFTLNSEGKVKGKFEQLGIAAKAAIDGVYDGHSLASNFSINGNIDQLKFTDFRATLGSANVQASGILEPLTQRLDLQLPQIEIDTGILTTLFPLPEELTAKINAKGSLKGSFQMLNFVGDMQSTGQYKAARFDINAALDANPDELEFKNFTGHLMMDGQSADIQAKGHYSIQNKSLDGHLKTDGLPLSVIELSDISLPETLSGEINADIEVSGSLPLPRVSGKLGTRGQYRGENFELAFVGNQSDKIFILDDINAKWMDTEIQAKGELSMERLNLALNLKQFQISDLSRLGLTLPSGAALPKGLLDIQLALSGSVEKPNLKGELELVMDGRYLTSSADSHQEDVTLKTRIETKDQQLLLHSTVLKGDASKADILLGARISPLLAWLLDQDSQIEFRQATLDLFAQGEMELAWLNDWLQQDAQYFSGQVALDMQLLGSIDKPSWQGRLGLTDGRYQNAISQTSLEKAEVELTFKDRKVEVTQATASDGQGGQLRLEGAIDLSAAETDQLQLTLYLDQASLLRREDIEGEASGNLKLSGSLNDMRLSGGLEVSPFQILLDKIESDSIPEIQVSSVDTGNTGQATQNEQSTIHLDLKINVDQQAFIRGRGLDAELKGTLQISGSNRQINYNGRFQVIRGTVALFAKTFKLEQGSVLFSNDAVSLFAQARHKAKDLTFIATLEGLLDDLKISLRTEPALPEDEALARLLFGKSVRNITPVQAIQLANAIQTLRGGGGQFDPLGTARDILQVDRISIESQETTEGNGVAIGLGKYVTDKVYVEVTRTPEPTQPWKGSVEVELTPNINLETTTSGSSGFGGVELQWKRDY